MRNNDEILLQKSLEHLNSFPGIQANFQKAISGIEKTTFDGCLKISSAVTSVDYACTIQPDISAKTVKLVISYFVPRRFNDVVSKAVRIPSSLPPPC